MRATVTRSTRVLTSGILALATVAAALATTAGPAAASTYSGGGCATVEIIGARATGEAPGMGQLLGPLATALQRTLPTTVAVKALAYPASFDYANSLAAGTTSLQALLTAEVTRCPRTKIVLMGYSQGAQVIGNAVDAVGPQLTGAVKARVAAVEQFGDPSFRGGESYDRGSSRPGRNGIFARPAGAYPWMATLTQSWCDAGDTYCQWGDTGSAHFTYGTHSAAAQAFVRARLGY